MANEFYLGNKVVVSDPCYDLGVWCMGILENVKEGNYYYTYRRGEENRIMEICAMHSDYKDELFRKEDFVVGVDSGQAGIFDYEYYKKNHEGSNEYWYNMVCDKTSGYVKNDKYIEFWETSDYKKTASLLNDKLNKHLEIYPNSDIVSVYNEIIEPYVKKDLGDFSDLLDVMKEILNSLDTKEKIKTEEEMALSNIKMEYSMIFHNLYMKYIRSEIGEEYIYMSMANIVDNKGLVSSSGWGDGSYTCLSAKDENGQIVGIKILFDDEDE